MFETLVYKSQLLRRLKRMRADINIFTCMSKNVFETNMQYRHKDDCSRSRALVLLQGAVTTKVFVFAACTGTIWQRCSGGGCSLAQLGDKNVICMGGLDSTGLVVAIDFPV